MWRRHGFSMLVGLLLAAYSCASLAKAVDSTQMVSEVVGLFNDAANGEAILQAARNLFGTLAVISLVWTMAALILRQDIGEVLMELVRFLVVTGTFYWLLDNASTFDQGGDFVGKIVNTFHELLTPGYDGHAFEKNGDSIVVSGLRLFFDIADATASAKEGDKIVAMAMGIVILVCLVSIAAQIVLATVTAWFLGYGGIFLLGFGGARWTSQIAVSFYKHVLAVGVVVMALRLVGFAASTFVRKISDSYHDVVSIEHLGVMLVGALLMATLASRLPQLLYTLVTGSTLGFFAGSAGMAGTAIATGGGAAVAHAYGAMPGSGGGGGTRRESAVEAVRRAPLPTEAVDTAGPAYAQGSSSARSSVFAAAAAVASHVTSHGATTSASSSVQGATGAASTGSYATNGRTATGTSAADMAAGVIGSAPSSDAMAAGAGERSRAATATSAAAPVRPDYDAEMSVAAAQRVAGQSPGVDTAFPPVTTA